MKVFFNIMIFCSLVFISCRGTTSKEPPIHLLQNMDDVGKLDPQSYNLASYEIDEEPFEDLNGNQLWDNEEPFEDLNENGKWDEKSIEYISENKTSMMSMPEGTIPTDPSKGTISDQQVAENKSLNTGRTKNGTFIEEIPYPITLEFINRGEERYNIYCSVCHGVSGNGDGIVLNEKYSWDESVKPANLLDLKDKDSTSFDGYLFNVISNGKNLMGGYGNQISVEDRWAIVSYLRALSYTTGCNEYSAIKKNLANLSLEEQLISTDFNCLIELEKVQDHYGEEIMSEIQTIIKCDFIDGEWGPGSKNKWGDWKEEYINEN